MDRYFFTVPLTGGFDLLISGDIKNKTTLDIFDIKVEGAEDHPDQFVTGNQSWDECRHGVRLGTAEVRRILRYVLGRIRQDHPAVDRLSGGRVRNRFITTAQCRNALICLGPV